MGVGNASQRKFGCLPRALDAFFPHVRQKQCTTHRPSSTSLSLFAIMLRVGGAGSRAHVSCCIAQAEARGLYDVTTNARASVCGTMQVARLFRGHHAWHVDLAGPWPLLAQGA